MRQIISFWYQVSRSLNDILKAERSETTSPSLSMRIDLTLAKINERNTATNQCLVQNEEYLNQNILNQDFMDKYCRFQNFYITSMKEQRLSNTYCLLIAIRWQLRDFTRFHEQSSFCMNLLEQQPFLTDIVMEALWDFHNIEMNPFSLTNSCLELQNLKPFFADYSVLD